MINWLLWFRLSAVSELWTEDTLLPEPLSSGMGQWSSTWEISVLAGSLYER